MKSNDLSGTRQLPPSTTAAPFVAAALAFLVLAVSAFTAANS